MRDVENLKTRNNYGDMVPIGSVATFRDTTGPFRVPRYNLYPAAEVQLGLARGFSTGQAIAAIEKIAKERLPQGFGFEWTEIALQEKLAGNTAVVAFGLAVVFVFLKTSGLCIMAGGWGFVGTEQFLRAAQLASGADAGRRTTRTARSRRS